MFNINIKINKNNIENNYKRNIILNRGNYFYSFLILQYCLELKEKLKLITSSKGDILNQLKEKCLNIVYKSKKNIIDTFKLEQYKKIIDDLFESIIADIIQLFITISSPFTIQKIIVEIILIIFNKIKNKINNFPINLDYNTIFNKVNIFLVNLISYVNDELLEIEIIIQKKKEILITFIDNIQKIIGKRFNELKEFSFKKLKELEKNISKFTELFNEFKKEIINKFKNIHKDLIIELSKYNEEKTYNITNEEKDILICSFYNQITDLNNIIKNKYNIGIIDIVMKNKENIDINDDIQFITSDNKINYGKILKINDDNTYTIQKIKLLNSIIQNLFEPIMNIKKENVFLDFIGLYKKNREEKNLNKLKTELFELLKGNINNYEIKLYIYMIFCPENILYIKNNQLDTYLYKSNNNSVLWNDKIITYINDNVITNKYTYKIKTTTVDDTFKILPYNDIYITNLSDETTYKLYIYKKILCDEKICIILLSDIIFENFKETFFYSKNIFKKRLLTNNTSFNLLNDILENDIIIPDENNIYKFLTKIKLLDTQEEGYIDLSDTTINYIHYNNLFEIMIKNLDSSIIQNIFKFKKEYTSKTNIIQNVVNLIPSNLFNPSLFKDIIDYIPISIDKKDSIDEYIYSCISYDYNFINTAILLEDNFIINGDYKIKQFIFEILSCFLDTSRLNDNNQNRIYNLFLTIIMLIDKNNSGLSRFIVSIFLIKDMEHKKYICYYLKTISNFHKIDIHDIILNDKQYINTFYIQYFISYNKNQSIKYNNIIDKNINIDDYDKMKIKEDGFALNKNTLSNIDIKKDDIFYKKKDEYPFIYNNKLYIIVFKKDNDIEFIILRNNIDYCL